ncbi:MAG: exodeoxyribonuclease VII large subunit [Planctomycetales bacterium]|nr:exodeoxyribonuclease VII large subunit [Planctomycetales bacterium]
MAAPAARSEAPEPLRPLTVTEVTRLVSEMLDAVPPLWVVGEVSGLRRAGSGHVYLTLKDEESALAAVLWRPVAQRVRFPLEDGLDVLASGELRVYGARGVYQLQVSAIEPRGVGARELALRALTERLRAEGLFEAARKRPLPAWPAAVGVVTSASGAAITDIVAVLRRRWPAARVLLSPVRVQGDGAAAEIAEGIAAVGSAPGVEVVIVGRGGGSLEDLWAWNEEAVARAIASSPVPVVSAVGHERDVTLADLVADRRAATPSEAAELVVPDREEIARQVAGLGGRLGRGVGETLAAARARLDAIAASYALRHPAERVRALAQRCDDLGERLSAAARAALRAAGDRLAAAAGVLESLSPLRVLARGYAVAQGLPEGRSLSDPAEAPAGTPLRILLARGRLRARSEGAE